MSQRTTATRNSGDSASSAAWICGSRWVSAYDLLGAGRAARQPLGVLGQRVEPDPLAAAHQVEEQVRRDPVQPALEGARRVAGQRPEHPDERLLGQVLGVLRVAREPVGQPVDPRRVLAHDLLPARRDPARRLGRRLTARQDRRRHRLATSSAPSPGTRVGPLQSHDVQRTGGQRCSRRGQSHLRRGGGSRRALPLAR